MDAQLIVTTDGSHTVHLPDLEVTFHSRFGAIRESMHIFIGAGLHEAAKTKSEIRIFEMGFGTGLNALLTLIEAEKLNLKIDYLSIEAFPIEPKVVAALNYEDLLADCQHKGVLKQMHAIPFEEPVQLSGHFTLTRKKIKLQDFVSPEKYDVIYFDAFAPDVQPELWTEEIFKKIQGMMRDDACLVTYCCKGMVRRAMAAAGLRVTKLPGPPGKKEIVRAFN